MDKNVINMTKNGKNQTVFFHLTPELKVFIGRTTREQSVRYASTYRTCAGFSEAIETYGWDNISHHIVENGLTTEQAKDLERQLLEAAGRQSYNNYLTTTTFQPDEDSLYKSSKNGKMKKRAKKETARHKRINGVGVELMLDNRYRQADGTYAIVVRLYHQRKYSYLPTGYSLTPDEFCSMDGRTEKSLNSFFDKVCGKVQSLTDDGIFTLKGFRCDNSTTSAGTLAELIGEKAALARTESTAKNYESTVKVLLKACPDGLELKSVNLSTIGDFHEYLRRNGYSDTTQNIFLSIIKAAINYGIYKGYLKDSQYPFKRNAYEIDKITLPKGGKRDSNYLTRDEVDALYGYLKEKRDKAVGCFLFSYLCGGINLADMLNLTYDDYYYDEGAFRFVREKIKNRTGQVTVIPVCGRLREVLGLSGLNETRGGKVFSCFEGKAKGSVSSYLNTHLKSVARKVGITKSISINTARHTFATIATKSGFPANMVEAAMSHAAGGVSSHYIGGWDTGEMLPYFDRLL